MKINVDELRSKLEPMAEALGFELVELTAPVVGGRLILRAFIHSPNGVRLDDCARVSREFSDLLDTDDLVKTRYTLEVSSLGLDKPLMNLKDFQRRVGEKVKIKYTLEDKEMTVQGILKNADESSIGLDTGDEIIMIPVAANPKGKIII